jgi:hypothetical protein
MENIRSFNSFEEYWPTYLAAHASRASQACHLAGVMLGVLTAVALVCVGLLPFVPLAVVPAQLGATVGHRLSPRKASALESESPFWGAAADLKMCALLVSGRLDRTAAA